jgi:ribonuclease HII
MNYPIMAGVDEVGRGPLAGPVVAAAVIFYPEQIIPGLKDSKALTESQREVLYEKITRQVKAWAIGRAEVEEIDRMNILQASLLAMQRAVQKLSILPQRILVDGNQKPCFTCTTDAIIKGDVLVPIISAASVLAKVTRDREMVEMDKNYSGYGFAKHKGYPTKQHMLALQAYGVTEIHRRSYAPVYKILHATGQAVES